MRTAILCVFLSASFLSGPGEHKGHLGNSVIESCDHSEVWVLHSGQGFFQILFWVKVLEIQVQVLDKKVQ